MVGLSTLWLPILLSAVIVFVVSSVIHMALSWHKNDYAKVPNEDQVMAALRPFAVPPGDYMMPRPASTQELGSPEFAEKLKQGPVMFFTAMPNRLMPMAKNPAQFLPPAVSRFCRVRRGRAAGGCVLPSCSSPSVLPRSSDIRSRSADADLVSPRVTQRSSRA
jgi:hypothetical protein